MSHGRVLIVDDEKLIGWSLTQMLAGAGYEVELAASGSEALERFETFRPHMILLDIFLPDVDGIELLRRFKAADPEVMVLMITANAQADFAVSAFKLGALDYIGKPFRMDDVRQMVRQAFEKKHLEAQVDSSARGARRQFGRDQLVGNSSQMIDVFRMINICAESDVKSVLILGESGTGKELVAQAIHHHSSRKQEPFIEVNCAAIPENLLENELFGHERGAFTDAHREEKGTFELADGGTVFLDEIGDMPLPMQAKILKVIESKRFRRLGGKNDIDVDVRIIAATHQNLPRLVEQERFRGDLFYRLNVMTIQLPALRSRRDDIPKLVDYFIDRLNDEYGRRLEGPAPDALEALMRYDWPGNVRELRNTIERAMMLEQGRMLSVASLPAAVRGKFSAEQTDRPERDARAGGTSFELPLEDMSLEEMEKHALQQAMIRAGGNQTKAARLLKMSRDTLRYRLKKFGLHETQT